MSDIGTGVDRGFTFFHCPNTRSSGTLYLIEEMGLSPEIRLVSLERGEHKRADYLAINPMGKVPAIRHGETVVTEQGAITLYLGDLFPETGMSPQMGDPARGAMLRWLFFYGSCFEPALVDEALRREPGKASMMPYGTHADTVAAVTGQLARGPWFLGERFSVVDALWGSALAWTTAFGLVPREGVIAAYLERIEARPAWGRSKARDAGFVAELKGRG